MSLDLNAIRRAFPILQQPIEGFPLAYFDSAATSQKPLQVLEAMHCFYGEKNANVHRGVHPLAEAATVAYESAREAVATFIRCKRHEIIFTKNATEAINLVAHSYGATLGPNDAIAITIMEHHSNIVPWMQRSKRMGTRIEWIGINSSGIPSTEDVEKVLSKGNVKLLAITGLSNVLGSIPDVTAIAARAHAHGAKVLVDASQLVAHRSIDVQSMDCDFLVFSSHKVYGPTGIGVLYGKADLLQAMPPFLGGGDMISSVTVEGFTPAEIPKKFEAGTPPIAEAVGLRAAIEWMQGIGMQAIEEYERTLLRHAYTQLSHVPGTRILSPTSTEERRGCISFVINSVHAHDLTHLLGQEGICLRAGHHCTQPLHRSLGINATTRLSVAAFNTVEEIDRCINAIPRALLRLRGY